MKKVFYFLLILLPVVGRAQKFKSESDIPEKRSSVILIKTPGPDEDIFKKAGRELISEGRTLLSSDANFFTITTNHESVKDYVFKTTFKISVLNGVVIIRANSTSNGFSFDPLFGNPRWKTVATVTFEMMTEYAKSLSSSIPGSIISYATE